MKRLVGVLAVAASMLAVFIPQAGAALKPGQVLIADFDADGLILVDTTGKQSLFAANVLPVNTPGMFVTPTDVAITPSGRVYVVDNAAFGGTGGVIAVDPATGKQTKVSANDQPVNALSSHFSDPNGIAILPSGQLLVTDRNAFGAGGVIAVDPATGKQTPFSHNGQPVNIADPLFADLRGGIVVTRDGKVLVTDTGGPEGVLSLDPATGKQTRFATNDMPVNAGNELFDLPVGIRETISGGLVVVDQNGVGDGSVIGVNPASGKQTVISHDGQPANVGAPDYSDPFHVAIGLDGRILVADISAFGDTGCSNECGGVFSVDPLTGTQGVLSSNLQPVNASSQLFSAASGIAVVPPRCDGRQATIYGTPSGDRIVGTGGADVIAALAGKDVVLGLAGKDRLCGGKGPDLLRGGTGNDRLRGDAGRDGLFGNAGRDRLFGGKGRDLLRGGKGRDRQRQ